MKKIWKIVEKILEVFPIKRKGVGMRMNTYEYKGRKKQWSTKLYGQQRIILA